MIKKVAHSYIVITILLIFSTSIFSIIDRSIATIHVGLNPFGIAITPHGKFAYVTNSNSNDIAGYNTVSVIDLETNQVIKTIRDSSFNGLTAVAINKQGSKVYVANQAVTTITVIDAMTNTVDTVIDGFHGPSGIALTSDGTRAYVSNALSGTVSVVDLKANAIVGSPVAVGLSPNALSITPDGALVYVVNYVSPNPGDGTISIIDVATNVVVSTIKARFVGPSNILIDSVGAYAYIANAGGNLPSNAGRTVSVLDLKTNKVVHEFTLGIQPSGLALSPSGRFLYVTNSNTLFEALGLASGIGVVAIVDLVTSKVLPQNLLSGFAPTSIELSADGAFAYVTNLYSDTVSVLNVHDQMWLYKN